LRAPGGLTSRVMAEIERQASLPWHRQAWQSWPTAVRWATLAVFLALFAGLGYGAWELSQTAQFTAAMHKVGAWFAPLGAAWRMVCVLWETAALILSRLSSAIVIGGFVAAATGYALCLGLGTLCFRLAYTRRR
jgi:hypothetical protein